jgi:hypothetical protein
VGAVVSGALAIGVITGCELVVGCWASGMSGVLAIVVITGCELVVD